LRFFFVLGLSGVIEFRVEDGGVETSMEKRMSRKSICDREDLKRNNLGKKISTS